MKKINLPLITGALILALLLVIIIFPGLFTNKSPYNLQKMIFSTVDGSLHVEKAPYPPSKDFIMGSDDLGRDIYSLIIHGTGLTLLLGLLIALGRFIIALPMAISAGFGNNLSKNIIRQFGMLFSAIPALLISVIILRLDFFGGLNKINSIAAFVIVLSITGWPKLGNLLMERVFDINGRAFIKGEVATGKGRLAIALENVFPHLAPEAVVLFFMEIARALSMIMQLGLFSIYVGLLKIILDTEGGVTAVDVSFEPEWASMLTSSRSYLTIAPWAVLFPALAFFISVLGFNLFGEGLRNILQKRDSMFVPRVRKFMTFNLGYIWGSYSRRSKAAFVLVSAAIALLVTTVSLAGGNRYAFDEYQGNLPVYEKIVAGSMEAGEAADMIVSKMEQLGLEPLKDEFILDYEFPSTCIVTGHSLNLSGVNTEVSFQYGIDYEFNTAADGEFIGQVQDATHEDLFNLDNFDGFSERFVMIDKSFYNDSALDFFIKKIAAETDIEGILLVSRIYEEFDGILSRKGTDYPVIEITQELAGIIKSTPDVSLTVSSDSEILETTGHNIFGMKKGRDSSNEEEAIVVSMGYNYLDEKGREVLGFNLRLMEEMCNFEDNSRSLIFMFTDGTFSNTSDGIYGVADHFPFSTSKTKVYIDLTGIQSMNFNDLILAQKQAPYTRAYAWSLAKQIGKELDKRNIHYEEADSVNYNGEFYYIDKNAANVMFWDNGVASIRIRTDENENGKYSIYELGEIILKTISNNNY